MSVRFFYLGGMEKGTLHTALEIMGWIACMAVGIFMLKIISLAL
jgi:hypothetical protein